MEWSLLMSGMGRRRLSPSRLGRDGKVCRDPNRYAVFKKVCLNRAFTSSALLGKKLLRLYWAIWRFGRVLVVLSTRGRREEWGKRRAMHGLYVLREGVGTVVLVFQWWYLVVVGFTVGVACRGVVTDLYHQQ
ncbi:hypothetical protein Taro_028876 [Colocasia esculenta]|uniref:Transmembrane protein n=1 Tax=Colocasia esculenta TaxID=4460 RepID=A0A843VHJ6_COLES|nr:hypothetical protein [Colocasia esculenta]